MARKILDFHTHAFPGSLAERALEALSANSGGCQPETDGTCEGLRAVMDAHGVEKAVLANIATKPSQALNIRQWATEIPRDRFIPFASVHPASPNWQEELEAAKAEGFPGIKLHPLYQNFYVDNPELFPFYEAVQALDLVLLMHAGYDIAFGEDDQALPGRFLPVVNQFPDLKLVMAHFGGWKRFQDFLDNLAGRDIWVDTSFAEGYCTKAQRDALLKKHDRRRILFGSDSPWGGMARQIGFVEAFSVSEAEKAAIFYDNACELLQI